MVANTSVDTSETLLGNNVACSAFLEYMRTHMQILLYTEHHHENNEGEL